MNLDLIAQFEEEYGCTVMYETFESNEMMYTKLSAGDTYDLIIPSDYMIERLIKEDMVQKLDFSKLDNYKYIADEYRDLYFDPTNEYSVP